MPTGRTQMTTQMRLAAILFVHRALYERKNKALLEINDKSFIEAADYYYSIISYFNSLKEVGKLMLNSILNLLSILVVYLNEYFDLLICWNVLCI